MSDIAASVLPLVRKSRLREQREAYHVGMPWRLAALALDQKSSGVIVDQTARMNCTPISSWSVDEYLNDTHLCTECLGGKESWLNRQILC